MGEYGGRPCARDRAGSEFLSVIRPTFLSRLCVAVAVPATVAVAQVEVEEEVVTDSVDVFAYEEPEKSGAPAMLASLALPGLGHQYLEKPNRALTYFTFEAIFIYGLAYSARYSRRLMKDSRAYAGTYADVQGGGGADTYFWQNVGRFMDSREYNRVLELNRTEDIEDRKYVGDNLQWRWANDSLREEYNEIRGRATGFQVASNFFIAAMVLNRVVAFIDARASSRPRAIRSTSLHFHPRLGRDDAPSLGMVLTRRF